MPQAAPVGEKTLTNTTEEDEKIHVKEGHTIAAIEDVTATEAGTAINPKEVEQEEENILRGEDSTARAAKQRGVVLHLGEDLSKMTEEDQNHDEEDCCKMDTATREDIQEEDVICTKDNQYKGAEDDQIHTKEDCCILFQHPCDLESLTLVKDTAADKVVVAEEDEEDDGLDVDNISLSVLIYDDEDCLYLQSLPELEQEGILGEHYDRLKYEIDTRKALRQARQKGTRA